MKRIGFVLDSLLPTAANWRAGKCGLGHLVRGWQSGSAIGEMRFQWLADALRGRRDIAYELYRPWRRYDAVVFLKSMGDEVSSMAARLASAGTRVLFDCNVDYVTPASGTYYYDGMAPTETQRQHALAMLKTADALIADSEHIADVCRGLTRAVSWIPDNVRMDLAPAPAKTTGHVAGKLRLLWSGMSFKVFDLLAIEGVLRAYRKQVQLVLIADSPEGMERIYSPYRERLRSLLTDLDAEWVRFTTVPDLLRFYGQGGVFVSPRFLDSPYNCGHTEWKITLPMACGRQVLCSPQRSYRTVAERARGGIAVCAGDDDWRAALDRLLSPGMDWTSAAGAAREVVQRCYAAEVVAAQHAAIVARVLEGTAPR